jgi:plasmid stabilization system protein ParE
VWLPESDIELKEAQVWYERVNPDLAIRFALAVEETLENISASPLRFPLVHKGRRRAIVSRFPYGIYFEIKETSIVVIACFHAHRDPKHWQMR